MCIIIYDCCKTPKITCFIVCDRTDKKKHQLTQYYNVPSTVCTRRCYINKPCYYYVTCRERLVFFFLGSDTCQGRAFVSPRGSAPTVNTPSTGACCSVCARTWKCIRMYTRVNMYYTGCSSSGDGGNNIITTAYVRTG